MAKLVKMQLPKSHPATDLEQKSKDRFRVLFDVKKFELREETKDKGIDFTVELKKDGAYTGYRFNVQLKASSTPSAKYCVSVKTSNINYLLNSVYPAFYVLYIESEDEFYFIDLYEQLGGLQHANPDWTDQSSCTFKFSKKLDGVTIEDIYSTAYAEGYIRRIGINKKIQGVIPTGSKLHNSDVDVNETHTGLNEKQKVNIELKRHMISVYLLSNSQGQERILRIKELLEEIIQKSKKYELYWTLIEALRFKKYFYSIKNHIEFNQTESLIEKYFLYQKAVDFATDQYFRIIIQGSKFEVSQKEHINAVKMSIKGLESFSKNVDSRSFDYYFLILKMFKFEQAKKYSDAVRICDSLFALVKKNASVMVPERLGMILLNKTQFLGQLSEFKKAIKTVNEAQAFYPKNSFNYLVANEQKLLLLFYAGETKGAFDVSVELINSSLGSLAEFRKAKYLFNKAAIQRLLGDNIKALKQIEETLEIGKNSNHFSLAPRLLKIMILVSLVKLDEAYIAIEGLRKFIERNVSRGDLAPKELLIYRMLFEFSKLGFDSSVSNNELSKLKKELTNDYKQPSFNQVDLLDFENWIR